MQNNTVLQKFYRFKKMFVSADISNNLLLELVESYITLNDEELAAEKIPIFDGQLSLFDVA